MQKLIDVKLPMHIGEFNTRSYEVVEMIKNGVTINLIKEIVWACGHFPQVYSHEKIQKYLFGFQLASIGQLTMTRKSALPYRKF